MAQTGTVPGAGLLTFLGSLSSSEVCYSKHLQSMTNLSSGKQEG